jgi:hypothetical protein
MQLGHSSALLRGTGSEQVRSQFPLLPGGTRLCILGAGCLIWCTGGYKHRAWTCLISDHIWTLILPVHSHTGTYILSRFLGRARKQIQNVVDSWTFSLPSCQTFLLTETYLAFIRTIVMLFLLDTLNHMVIIKPSLRQCIPLSVIKHHCQWPAYKVVHAYYKYGKRQHDM